MQCLLNRLQLKSAATHIAVWSLVLTQGIVLIHFDVEVPWYKVEETTTKSWPLAIAELSEPQKVNSSGSPELADDRGATNELAGYAFAVWMGVCIFLLFRWCCDYARFVISENSSECDRDEWNQEWDSVKAESQVTARIPLHVSQNIGPLLCRMPTGYRVVVPYRLWKSVTAPQRRLMLRHELAHFQRGDIWWSLVAHLAAIPHWFNPLAWFAVRRLEQGLEWACDDKASETGDQQPTEYASTLLAIGEFVSASVPRCVTAIHGSQLGGRINRLLTKSPRQDKPSRRMIVLLAAVVLVAIHLFRVDLVAQQTNTQDDRASENPAWRFLLMDGKQVFDPAVLSETEARDIALNGAQITDDELKRLADHTSLETLRFFGTNIKGPGLKHLSTLTNLEQIVFAGPHVTNEWLENLPALSGLRSVVISQTRITEDGLIHLKRFPRLRVLDLRYSNLGDGPLKVLEHLPNLGTLYLGNTRVGDEALANLKFTPKLSRLDLKRTAVTDAGLEHLRHVPHLLYFSLGSDGVKGPGTANLRHMKKLEQLQFVGKNVSDSWLHSIPALKELYWLELHDTSITSAGLRSVGTWTKLEQIYLNKNSSIDDEIANHLDGLRRLEILELRETGVTSEGTERLRGKLPLAQVRAGDSQPQEGGE